ncbi:MAG: ATP synthase F1 subunit delta [Planctomycetota bacterium]|nr:ATP synthase F1 subunit delta [Planctomycetota bacterium]
MQTPIARPYAEALVEIAEEKGLLDEFREDLDYFLKYLQEDSEFHVFFESPRIDREVKRRVLRNAFDGKLDDLIVSFLELLVEKGRQLHVQEIIEAFIELYDEKTGRIGVRMSTAVKMTEVKKLALTNRLSEILGKKIHMETEVDPGLFGGIVLHVGDTVVDGSLKHRLDELSRKMRDARMDGEGMYED